jgi:hypothetical protein
VRFETFVRDVRKALESVDGDLLVETGQSMPRRLDSRSRD